VQKELAISPAYGCAAFSGSETIMKQLLDHGQIDIASLHRELEFAIEPHQPSGEPFHSVALEILAHGFDINSIRPSQGRTLLHGCANRGTNKATQWLLENGAHPNVLDNEGGTPLHTAAKRNTYTGVSALLIDAGADVSVRNNAGETAHEVAIANGRHRIVDFFQEHIAKA
jgi:ankyrin repeat protein